MRTLGLAAIVAAFEVLGGTWVVACSVDTNGTRVVPEDSSPEGSALDGTTEGSDDASASHDVVAEPVEENVVEASHADAATEGGGNAPKCTSANCPGACCGDQCIVDRSCAGCASGNLFCPYSTTVVSPNGQCVSSCSTCTPEGVELSVACYSCGSAQPAGSCAGTANDCPVSLAAGACPCSSGDAGACPGPYQVCLGSGDAGNPACLSCGQPLTQGQPCGDGLACNETKAACGM